MVRSASCQALAVFIILSCVLACQSCLFAEDGRVIDLGERLKLMRVIAAQMRANEEGIRTWEGKYLVTDEAEIDGAYGEIFRKELKNQPIELPLHQIATSEMRFAVDSEANAIFTTLESLKAPAFHEAQSGKELTFSVVPFQQRSILTGEHFLSFKPNVRLGQIQGREKVRNIPREGGRVAFRQEPSNGQRLHAAQVIDPRLLISVGGTKVSEILDVWATWLDRRPGDRRIIDEMIEVRREGTKPTGAIIVVITRGPEVQRIRTTYTFRPQLGFNITDFAEELVGGARHESCTWSYRKQADVYVPERIEKLTYNTDGASVRTRRLMKLGESAVNAPLSKQYFDYSALGLASGERVVDEINNAVYVLDGTHLVSAEVLPPPAPEQRSHFGTILVIVNAAAIGFVVVWFWLKRRSNLPKAGDSI
jgi:hypothetical protein